jgi:hypothetical protein
MWSWCDIGDHNIPLYLDSMEWLIGLFGEGGSHARAALYPVQFIFMTGHANADANVGEGNAKSQAQLIIDYCNTNDLLCLDYYSIDTHDMDDNYWEDAGDNGNSDSYGGNFYQDFQDAHELGDAYYENLESPGGDVDYGEHTTQHITSNRKAYAMWWIMARIAGWDGGAPVNDIQISSEGDITQIMTGEELQFSSTVLPLEASNPTVKWQVNNLTGSATISQDGLLTALTEGNVDVIATAEDGSGVNSSLSISILGATVMVSEISIASAEDVNTMEEGEILEFTALVLPENASNQHVSWSVINGSGTGTICGCGYLSAITEGTVDVVATALDSSGISSSFAVTITGPDAVFDETDGSPIILYPNPSMGKFYLNVGVLLIERVEVISAGGSVVLDLVPDPGDSVIEMDLSDRQPGIFFIRALSEEHFYIHRIIISG